MSIFTGLISDDFKQLHIDMITEVISGCAVPCTLVYGNTKWNDCANCWESGTMIRTEGGFKKIEDIEIGDRVYNSNNSIGTVVNTGSRFSDENMFNISCWSSSLPHKVTGGHKFPVVRNFRSKFKQKQWYDPKFILDTNGLIEEVAAEDLSIDDAMIVPYSNHPSKDLEYWNECSVDEDLLYLIGWWLAEGCLHKDKCTRSGSFCLCASKEEPVAHKLQDILLRKFNLESKLEYREDADNLLVNWYSSELAKTMIKFGCRAENKVIPQELWIGLSIKQKMCLLDSYHHGDGNTFDNPEQSIHGRESVVTVSEILALQVHDILISSGYFPSINWREKYTDKNGINHQRSFTVQWQRDRKQQKSNVRKSDVGLLVKVREISETKEVKYVYNLEVDGIHKYIAGTCLTFNCIYDPIGNKSSNRYQAGGPMPFTVGGCPMCYGTGKTPDETTTSINLCPIYDYKQWIPNITSAVQSPNGMIQTISKFSTYEALTQAKELLVDTDIETVTRQRFERASKPEPCGIGGSDFIVMMWKLIENG